ncbi:MAG: hypothetical protein LBD30_01945, partial [Verrucomicrobiales bacterium]|nr:hypothetical protein [Verrucomicrobiales bacterium]
MAKLFSAWRVAFHALIIPLLLSVGAVAADGQPPRVALSVSGSNAESWQSVLTAELGKLAELQIVERAEYGRVLREREELALRGDGQRQLPPLAGIAFYLHFREMNNGRWLVELVNAADGRLAGSSEAAAATAGDAARLSAAAQKLLVTAAAKKSAARAARIAVVEPTGKLADDQTFILAARLRDAVTVSGFTVLDRALTQELVIERNEAERGLRDVAPAAALLGADYLLQLAPADGQYCELRLVNTADSHLVAAQMFTFDGPALINKIQPWLFPLLGVPERAAQPYLPSVSVEALQPFYRGLKLYDEGEFARAANEFNRAYMLDRQFKVAYEWEARCYDALTLTPLGDALRRYARVYLDFSVSTNDDAPAVSDAVMFLGVSGGAPELCASLSALAADALVALPELKISLPENLAQVCREHDWLAGIA